MQALHFGAGNIGRGFIGKLLADAGIKVTFADVNQTIVEQLNMQHQYRVNVVGDVATTEIVTGVDAVNSQSDDVITKIAQVDLITTAVGPQILPRIANTVASGLIVRYERNNTEPLNIIACENMVRGTSQFKQQILTILPVKYHDWVEQYIGFVDSAVDRIVPPVVSKNGDSLDVTVETFAEWIVDRGQFKGALPTIPGMEATDNLMAFVERKLFTLNTGHAITAYLGHYYGFTTIKEAIADQRIRLVVRGAMAESGVVLINRYHFDQAKHNAYIDKILTRFANPYLHDDTDRVGRQPLRKLSPGDRLIKPLLGTFEYQLSNNNLLIGIAAALNYRNNNDEQAQEMVEMIARHGVSETFCRFSAINRTHPVVKQIGDIYRRMQNKGY